MMRKYSKDLHMQEVYQAYLTEKSLIDEERARRMREEKIEEQQYYRLLAQEDQEQQQMQASQKEEESDRDEFDREQLAIQREMDDLRIQHEIMDGYEGDVDEDVSEEIISAVEDWHVAEQEKWKTWEDEYRVSIEQEKEENVKAYWKNQKGKQVQGELEEPEAAIADSKPRRVYRDSFFKEGDKNRSAMKEHKNARASHGPLLRDGKNKKSTFFDGALCKSRTKDSNQGGKPSKSFRI